MKLKTHVQQYILVPGLFLLLSIASQAQSFNRLANINPHGSSNPYSFTMLNGKMYFMANNDSFTTWLWQTDGTNKGTQPVLAVYKGKNQYDTFPGLVGISGGKMFFVGNDGTNGPQLWASDGTVAGTGMVKNISPGGTNITAFMPYNGKVYFPAYVAGAGYQLWASDGTATGTIKLKDTAFSQPSYIVYQNKLFFSDSDAVHGAELWTSDGTVSGTRLFKDLTKGPKSSYPTSFKIYNNKLCFVAIDSTESNRVWESDGTVAGTAMLQLTNLSIETGLSAYNNFNDLDNAFVEYKGKLFFFAVVIDSTRNFYDELCAIDSTSMNIGQMVSNLYYVQPVGFDTLNGKLYFMLREGHNHSLLVSDGTSGGTYVLKRFFSQTFKYEQGSPFANYNSMLYFRVYEDTLGYQLWQTDGTNLGTKVVAPVGAGADPLYKETPLMIFDTALYFAASYDTSGMELWQLKTHFHSTGVEELPLENSLLYVYPNPSNSDFHLRASGLDMGPASLSVYNMAGQKVYGVSLYPDARGNLNMDILTSKFERGIYFVELLQNDKRAVQKVVLE